MLENSRVERTGGVEELKGSVWYTLLFFLFYSPPSMYVLGGRARFCQKSKRDIPTKLLKFMISDINSFIFIET